MNLFFEKAQTSTSDAMWWMKKTNLLETHRRTKRFKLTNGIAEPSDYKSLRMIITSKGKKLSFSKNILKVITGKAYCNTCIRELFHTKETKTNLRRTHLTLTCPPC
jgi:hypothetical protein